MTENLQADGVQSRQTLFVRYCLRKTTAMRKPHRAADVKGFLFYG